MVHCTAGKNENPKRRCVGGELCPFSTRSTNLSSKPAYLTCILTAYGVCICMLHSSQCLAKRDLFRNVCADNFIHGKPPTFSLTTFHIRTWWNMFLSVQGIYINMSLWWITANVRSFFYFPRAPFYKFSMSLWFETCKWTWSFLWPKLGKSAFALWFI